MWYWIQSRKLNFILFVYFKAKILGELLQILWLLSSFFQETNAKSWFKMILWYAFSEQYRLWLCLGIRIVCNITIMLWRISNTFLTYYQIEAHIFLSTVRISCELFLIQVLRGFFLVFKNLNLYKNIFLPFTF